jgi:anti-sigma B factor antagonist
VSRLRSQRLRPGSRRSSLIWQALEFMDSSGVAALVRGRKHARHAGGDLLLAAPQQQVLRVLAITRI